MNGTKTVEVQKYKATADNKHAFIIAPHLLDQVFSTDRPNQERAADISYIQAREGWLYLAEILDLYARHVIG